MEDVEHADLQVGEDLPFQRRTWAWERIGWGVIAAVVGAALAGLFGPGPLSHAQVTSPDDAVVVRYLRFHRAGGTTQLDVEVDGSAARDGQVTVLVAQDYLDAVDVERVVPAPADEVAVPDGVRFVFTLAPTASLHASFQLRPVQMGWAHGRVAVGDGSAVAFRQFFYP